MLKGELTYINEGFRPQTVCAGDLYCQRANLQTILQGSFYQFMFVTFNGKKAGDLMRSIGHDPANPVINNPPERIRNLMHEIMKALPTKRTYNPFFFITRITAIAEAICETNLTTQKSWKQPYSKLMRQKLEEMEYQCPGVTEMADEIDVRPNTLRKACLRETGMPAKDFLINLRIERAKELLKTTPYKIEHIARTCGYSNDKHFYKSFRQHIGETPARWRKTHKTS